MDTTELVFAVSFAVYTLGIIGVGVYASRFARESDEDYFLAGRSLNGWVAALSASASSESGWVTVGLVGMAYTNGFSAYWIMPGCLFGFLFNWFVIAGRMRDRAGELNALTLPDMFSFHFKERVPVLRVMSVVVILVAMAMYVAAQFAAAGKAFEAAFPAVNYQAGVLIGVSIVLAYTVFGGFRAVCWTDFLQALLMVGTLVIFPLYLFATHGGYGFLADNLSAANPEMREVIPSASRNSSMAILGFLLGSNAMGINFGYPGQPHVLVRFMALKSRKEAIVGGVVSATWGMLVLWGAVTIGLMAAALTNEGVAWTSQLAGENGGENGLVVSAANLLPPVLSGLVLAAVLSAICSTADSQLVVAASSAANDIYARLIDERKSGSHALINRTTVFVLGILAGGMVFSKNVSVYEYVTSYGWAIMGAAFGPQLLLMLLWRRATWAGCVAGMFSGFGVALLWKLVLDNKVFGVEAYNLTVAFIAALIVNVVVSLVTPGRHSA